MTHYYMIMPVADISPSISAVVLENSGQNLANARRSIDGTKCVFEIYAPIPEGLRIYNVFSHERILEVMQEPEWYSEGEQQSMLGSLMNMFKLS